MFTTIAFAESPGAAAGELITLDGVRDQTHRVVGDDIFVGSLNQVIALYAFGYNINKALITSPSLRALSEIEIEPKERMSALILGAMHPEGHKVRWTERSPIPLTTNEALNAKARTNEVTGTLLCVGVLLSDGPITPVVAPYFSMPVKAAGTFTAGEWVNAEMTFDTDLPVGRYQIIGATFLNDGGGMFRLVPVAALNRPGARMNSYYCMTVEEKQTGGRLGVWCEFDQLTPPSVDILAWEDGTVVWGSLDMVKVS